MKITNTIKISLAGLKANKLRSALTILGIVIGITSIILVVSIGNGAQSLILGEIQSMGSKTLTIQPGKPSSNFRESMTSFFQQSLKEKDLVELQKKNNVPHLDSIMPIVFTSDDITYENESYSGTIIGTSEKIFDFYNIKPAEGDFFTEYDVKDKTDVCVIGVTVKDKLFGASDPVGQKIRIKNKALRIIGVLPDKSGLTMNYNESVIAPYTTVMDYILGQKYYNEFVIQVDNEQYIDQTVEDIKTTIRNSHDITDPDEDDFKVMTQKDLMSTVSTVTTVMTLFLAMVAAISLLVGGVGIMNVMFISVTERTKEIGLRKALGATNSDILNQFLFEAIYLTMVGGILGIFFGSLFSYLTAIGLSSALSNEWVFTFPYTAALGGILTSVVIGIVFGIYPAYSASKKNPIEALRYE